ncbi:MAG: hypothetical protein J6Z28_00515 [Succinivibrio sp.]|nr:hypothetical protein [Succinivibrio sp.]
MKRILFYFMMLLSTCILITGCVISGSNVTPDENEAVSSENAQYTKNTIYIGSISDVRKFQQKSDDRSVPVLDTTKYDKSKVIGKKRSTIGLSIGTLYLDDNQTVSEFIKESFVKAAKQSGYTVIENKAKIDKNTVRADIQIVRFWTWYSTGVWDIDIKAEIENTITLKSDDKTEKLKVKGSSTIEKPIGTDKAYNAAVDTARDNLVKDIRAKLRKSEILAK